MLGSLQEITGIPIYEDKLQPEGTYTCLDKDNLPIKPSDISKTAISKIIVHDFETFKIAMKNNQSNKD